MKNLLLALFLLPLAVVAQTTDVTMGSVTFTLEGTLTSGNDAAGTAWVVVPSGSVNITGITPNEADDGSGNTVNGAMLNPMRDASDAQPDQGYDERESTYNAAVAATYPLSVTAGDVVIKTVARVPSTTRGGRFDEIAALHVLDTAPTGEYLLGSSTGWAGKSTPDYYTIDLDTWYDGRTVYSSASLDFPSYANLMSYLDQFHPLFGHLDAPNATAGYESFSPHAFGGGRSTAPNYGRYIAQLIGMATAAITTDQYTETETKNIARRLIQHGIEWGDPILYSSRGKGPDGGHFQFHQAPTLFALSQTGRSSEIPNLMISGGGNWKQAFLITSEIRKTDFVPHDSTSKPATWRRRTLSTQPGGSVVRIPGLTGDDTQTAIHAGSIATRESDGQTAIVATTTDLVTSGTVDIPLTGATPFSSGDIIYFEAPATWVTEGKYDWTKTGLGGFNKYSPSSQNEYRDLQAWFAALLAIRAMGLFDATLQEAEGYAIRAGGSDPESGVNNFPSANQNWKISDITEYTANTDYYTQHGSTILALDYSTDTATVETALNVEATATAMADGLVVGLVPGETSAWVNFKGTATGDDIIEVRVLEQGDDTVVQDWTPVAQAASGVWEGELLLPKASDWWKVEARAASNRDTADTLAEKWAVGYKIILLGQSQMAIMMTTDGSVYDMEAGHEGTASYYQWHSYGYNGTPAATESLVLLTNSNGTDGLHSFVDQLRIFEPDTPVMLIREAVNGTSILDFLDDEDGTRAFSDLTDKLDKYGNDVSVVVESWVTSNASPLDGDEGIDLLQGLNTHGFGVEWSLADVLQAGYVFVEGGGTRHNYTSISTYKDEVVQHAQSLGYAIGPPINDYELANGDTAHPRGAGQGSTRLGARLAVAVARGLGLDASANPSLGSVYRSFDGTSLYLTIARPNGGDLYSPAPNALTGFRISEDSGGNFSSTGYTPRIAGNVVEFVKSSGTWAAAGSIVVLKHSNLSGAVTVVTAEEQILIAGELYEAWSDDVLGLGLPVHGVMVGDVWTMPPYPNIGPATQLAEGEDPPDYTPVDPDPTPTGPIRTDGSGRISWSRGSGGMRASLNGPIVVPAFGAPTVEALPFLQGDVSPASAVDVGSVAWASDGVTLGAGSGNYTTLRVPSMTAFSLYMEFAQSTALSGSPVLARFRDGNGAKQMTLVLQTDGDFEVQDPDDTAEADGQTTSMPVSAGTVNRLWIEATQEGALTLTHETGSTAKGTVDLTVPAVTWYNQIEEIQLIGNSGGTLRIDLLEIQRGVAGVNADD